MIERREFFKVLIANGAVVKSRPQHKNRRAHHLDTQLYHGPMLIPERISNIIAEHPSIKQTTHGHLVSRYAENEWTWIFRCQIPFHRNMIGELVMTPEQKIRVHCWSVANPELCMKVKEPSELLCHGQAIPTKDPL